MIVDEATLAGLIAGALARHGLRAASAASVAAVVAAAECQGALSHGLLRLPGYLAVLRSGWVNGQAVPRVQDAAPGLIAVDGDNGFAQPALDAVRAAAAALARSQGVAAVCLANTHHFAALWPDVEPFAADGLVALTVVNSRSRMVMWGGQKKVLGTNPMAFACPRRDAPPVVWDQASSLRAQGELLLARQEGHAVPEGAGVDAAGLPSTDPAAILDGGAFLPFGGHKGAGIAFMVEVLAAAFTGGRFGFEDESQDFSNAMTSNAGQFLLLADPMHVTGSRFYDRIEDLVAALKESGAERLPGERRHARRGDSANISDAYYRMLTEESGC